MIPDLDIWRAAMAIVKRYGDDAMLEAAARADSPQAYFVALSASAEAGASPSGS